MKKVVTYLILAAVLLQGCHRPEWASIEKSVCGERHLIPDKIVLDSTIAVRTWDLCGEYVIMLMPDREEEFLHVYTYPEFEFLGQYLRYGRSHDEYLSANLVGGDRQNEFLLYDMNNKVIRKYSISDTMIAEMSRMSMKSIDRKKSNILPPYVDILSIDDDRYIFHISNPSSDKLLFADIMKWKPISGFYDMLDGRDKTRNQYLDYFYCIDATQEYVVRAFERIEEIDVYKSSSHDYYDPYLSIKTDVNFLSEDTYYLDVDCGTYSFAVCRYEKHGCYLEVYDYEGNMKHNIPTANLIYNIIYDEEQGKIYAYAEDIEESTILVYSL